MLVLIVVAAATAFAFFVASEEKTELAQRGALDLKNAENLTVKGIDLSRANFTTGDGLNLTISSSDVNSIAITGILINGAPVSNFTASAPCTPTVEKAFLYVPHVPPSDTSTLNLTPFSACQVTVDTFFLPPDLSAHEFKISFSTARGNDFTDLLLAPVAEFSITYAGTWPVLDGAQSYQPSAKNTVESSILSYNWTVRKTNVVNGYTAQSSPLNHFFGQSAQIPKLTPGASYWINLTVTNTFGMSGTVDEMYRAPGTLTNYSVTFSEAGLPNGTSFSVTLGHVTMTSPGTASITTLVFDHITNGTYTFSIAPVPGFTQSNITSPGTITVAGTIVVEPILTYT